MGLGRSPAAAAAPWASLAVVSTPRRGTVPDLTQLAALHGRGLLSDAESAGLWGFALGPWGRGVEGPRKLHRNPD